MQAASLLRSIDRTDQAIRTLCTVIMVLAVAGMFFVLLASVFARYAGVGNMLTWASELPELLFPWLVMAGVVLAASRGTHLSIMFITQRLHGRWMTAAVTLRAVVVIYVYGRLTAAGLEILPIVADEHTAILGASSAWTYGCVVGGVVLLVVEEIFGWLRHVLGVSRAAEPVAHVEAA
ncbi:TRAP transporter small permease subunit [Pigmentiphaga aceris]|uniref:TRAP transporter small permease protein n=1 Tax=Pigmentiphaga aceris TaxID=1940612 RepID=A0A5C0AU84_9BURK|nr:TRAP transporter small permease subunit [Pigmentiphaga aceris]QEI05234.1 TRAP transporter small permease subunit [Pigmentiphaga aceris]